MNLPSHVSDFELLSFIHRKTELMWLYGSMELLNTKNNPELQKKIDVVKDHLAFLYRLESEYNAINKVNCDYVNQNLVLLDKYQKLSNKNKELEKELKTLKENFANQ